MNDKGIIHCNSREFANKIFEKCYDYGRFINYENSFEKEAPLPNTEIPTTEPAPSVTKLYDYLETPNEAEGYAKEIALLRSLRKDD